MMKKLIFASCLFITATGVCAVEKITSEALELDAVLQLEKSGDLSTAESKLSQLFDQATDNPSVRLAYGRVLTKLAKSSQAIEVLSPLTSQSQQDWRPWFWTGTAMLLNNELENAGAYLDEALAREGEEVSIWVQRAIVEQEKNNSQASVYMLQVADNLQPGNPDVMLNFAYANEAIGEINKSIIAYKHFLKSSTSDKQYGKLRSLVLLRLAEIENARKKQALDKVKEVTTVNNI